MKQLSAIETPPTYFEWHTNIVCKKRNPNRSILQGIETRVEERFNEYETATNSNTLESIIKDEDLLGFRDELQGCYGSKTIKLSEMLKVVSDSQSAGVLKWCPYCGLTRPGSYDHYLPKEDFPEFSVNPQNLVSCCTNCNSSKGARWIDEGERLFIHFYSDEVPEAQFLFVDLSHNEGAFCARFRVIKPEMADDVMWAVIEKHFHELKLLGLYKDNANDEISEILNMCLAHLADDGSNVSVFLEKLAQGQEKTFGKNHWRIVLMRALAKYDVFLQHVESEAELENK